MQTTSVGHRIWLRLTKNTAATVVIAGSVLLALVIGVFAGPAQLINSVVAGGMWALLAVGLALIFGVANVPYFAHGESFMIGAFVAFFVFDPIRSFTKEYPNALLGAIGPFIAFFVAAFAGAFLGLILERFFFRPLRRRTEAGACD